jgi:hypothetical protein
MRTVSAANAKGRAAQTQIPREGSVLRVLWDVLHEHAGVFVDLRSELKLRGLPIKSLQSVHSNLSDIYGLDIRVKHRGSRDHPGRDSSLYCLVGEWFGRVYIDYLTAPEARPTTEHT